jgi:hypothetical protein
MSHGSTMNNGSMVIRKRLDRALIRFQRVRDRRTWRFRLGLVAGVTAAGLLLWLKISLSFGHGDTVA